MFEKRKESATQNDTSKNGENSSPLSESETPLWQEKTTPQPKTQTTSLIGASIKIKGDVYGDANLVIEGSVDGFVQLPSHDLTIGATGTAANLSAKSIKIDGTVEGNIEGSDIVTISKSGKVKGDITAPRVTLEEGAQFRGSIDMDPSSSPTMPVEKPANTTSIHLTQSKNTA